MSSVRRDFGALWFLESRQTINRLKFLARSPGRVIFYLAFVGYFVAAALLRAKSTQASLHLPEPYASASLCAFAALLAVIAYGAASGYAGAFSSAADARFLAGSVLDERFVVLWLQVRRALSAMGRMLATVLLYVFFVSHSLARAGFAFSILGGTACATAIAVPALKGSRVLGSRVARSLCGALAAIAILPMLILLSDLFRHSATAAGVERLGLGAAVNAMLHGNALALSALWGFCALLLAAAWLSGNDLYPELYAASLRAQQFRARTKRGGSILFTAEQRYVGRSVKGPLYALFDNMRGSWAIIWKEWIAFVRSPSLQRLFVFGLLGSAAAGVVLAEMSLRTGDSRDASLAMLAPAFTTVLIMVAMGSAITLSNDLRKPVWWLGRDPLWLRLFSWTCATSWRTGAMIYSGLLGWALTMRLQIIAVIGVPVAVVAVVYLRSIGLFIYSLFPSSVDQRGPLAFVRALMTYLLAVPPAVAAVLAYLFLAHRVEVAAAAATGVALLQSLLLVRLAARRIVGSGVAFTQAELA